MWKMLQKKRRQVKREQVVKNAQQVSVNFRKNPSSKKERDGQGTERERWQTVLSTVSSRVL